MTRYLVIVESPAKSKTITKFLGKGYLTMSSMGHIVDLPKSKMGVDIENDFKPSFVVIAKRRKLLTELKKNAKGKDDIFLAMDPDREGEAIAFHLRNSLLGANKKIHRVTFHEVTEKAIKEAINRPHEIDLNKVEAQQARRILDRILGYSLSPLLWKNVGSGLSAGRVQSVALMLIVEREEKIKAFVPEEYWDIDATLKKLSAKNKDELKPFAAKLTAVDGQKPALGNGQSAEQLADSLKKERFIVKNIKEARKHRSPLPPYITSTLQQDGFNKLGFSVSKTMKIAQELYEGIELGHKEATGLITYMRTDSVVLSKEAQDAGRSYITKKFGKAYCPAIAPQYRAKKTAQQAHEAIRPSLPLREPDGLRPYLNPNQFRLYELVWNRFLASQMEHSLSLVVSAEIEAGRCMFRASGSKVLFDGFTVLYPVEKKENGYLPPLAVGESLDLIKLEPSQHFTNPPPRFSDASLVKAMEEKGIGRPSTYAPIIYTIILRNYVKREKGYLYPTELGTLVTGLLTKHFPRVLDIKFTAYLEDELDDVEDGRLEGIKVLRDFYGKFKDACERASKEMANVKQKAVPTGEKCPECGNVMVIKWGRKGKFLSCSKFPKCKFAKSITTGVKCPLEGCGGELIERRSSRGRFYGCTNYPKCRYVANNLPTQG